MLKRLILLFTISSILTGVDVSAKGDGFKDSFSIDSISNNLGFDLRLNYAFFIHHHNEMTGYPKSFPMFELSLQKQTYGNQSWQSYFNYPIIGVTAFYSNLGNVDIIGNAYAIYPFINFPFNKSKVNTFGLRFGVGIGYITEKYHPIENYHNTSIGSNINAAISITFEYKRQISERFKISTFAGLTHFSNGCSHEPNSGINIINAGLSTSYLIGKQQTLLKDESVASKENFKGINPEYYICMSFGVKRTNYNQKDNFGVYDLEVYAMDKIGQISKIGLALDFTYNRDNLSGVANYYGTNTEYKFFDLLKPGIGFAYELMMGDLSFLMSIGFHTFKYDASSNYCYQKLAAKLDFGKYLFGKIALNTHFGAADFIGFGLGVKL